MVGVSALEFHLRAIRRTGRKAMTTSVILQLCRVHLPPAEEEALAGFGRKADGHCEAFAERDALSWGKHVESEPAVVGFKAGVGPKLAVGQQIVELEVQRFRHTRNVTSGLRGVNTRQASRITRAPTGQSPGYRPDLLVYAWRSYSSASCQRL